MLNSNYRKHLFFQNSFNKKRLYVTCLKTSVMSSLTGDSWIHISTSAASHCVKVYEGNRMSHDGKLEKEGLCGPPLPTGPSGSSDNRITAFEKRIKYMNRESFNGQTT